MKATPIFILLILSVSIVFDFWIILDSGKTESISAYVIRWSKEHPSIPFVTGYLMGHLFWRMPDKSVYGEKK